MPEIAGTMPAVRERPKVAKRPTVSAPKVAEKATVFKKKAEPEPSQSRAITGHTMPEKKPLVLKKAEPKRDLLPTVAGPTLPKKKPLVKKKPRAKGDAKPGAKEGIRPEQWRAVNWLPWLPLAVGIALGFLAPQIYALAAHWDPWGLRAVFPFVQLAALHEIGMSDELTRTVPQLMLYLQFPLEGLLVASNLRRGMRPSKAAGPILPLHFVAGLVLWIVALGSARHI